MKALVAIVVAFVAMMVFGRLIGNSEIGYLMAIVLALLSGYLAYKHFGNYKNKAREVATQAIGTARKATGEAVSIIEGDELQYFATAEQEADSGTYDKGLWAQALVKAGGDEAKRKITYIKLRVAQLKRTSSVT